MSIGMSATRERPILFGGPMVRAILDGRKTQTRRVVTPQPPHSCTYTMNGAGGHALCFGPNRECVPPTGRSVDHRLSCPYGAPGDRLWVRETWCYDCSTVPTSCIVDQTSVATKFLHYRADWASGKGRPSGAEERWRSPFRMWRWASRITLEVVRVRVERVQEISEADAIAEGCVMDADGKFPAEVPVEPGSDILESWDDPREWFADLWDSINAMRGFGWAANPWVWVVEFKRVESKSGGGA